MPWETMSQTGKVPPQPTSLHNGLMKTHHTGVAVKMQPSPMAAAFGQVSPRSTSLPAVPGLRRLTCARRRFLRRSA